MKGSEHCQTQLDSLHKKREKQKTKRRSKAGSTNANQYDDFLQKDLHNTSASSMQTLEQVIFACSNCTTVEKRDVHDIAPWGRCNFHMLLSQRSQRRDRNQRNPKNRIIQNHCKHLRKHMREKRKKKTVSILKEFRADTSQPSLASKQSMKENDHVNFL